MLDISPTSLNGTTDLPAVDDPPDVGDRVGVVGQAPEVEAVSEEAGVRTLDGHEAGRNCEGATETLTLNSN